MWPWKSRKKNFAANFCTWWWHAYMCLAVGNFTRETSRYVNGRWLTTLGLLLSGLRSGPRIVRYYFEKLESNFNLCTGMLTWYYTKTAQSYRKWIAKLEKFPAAFLLVVVEIGNFVNCKSDGENEFLRCLSSSSIFTMCSRLQAEWNFQ